MTQQNLPVAPAWELLDNDQRMGTVTDRMRTPSGWIVRTRLWAANSVSVHHIFVADGDASQTHHSWGLK